MRLFAAAIFLGAFLLFQVQPLIGKYILPRFGSAPGVWTTCLLFFQVLLLAGYGYAHLLVRWFSARAQAITHAALLGCALVLLPITPSEAGSMSIRGNPTWQILLLLAASVGAPYLLLSATGPLLQAWFLRARPGKSPYRLYALSNVGSILALVTYPIVVEPYLGLGNQTLVWSGAFVAFAICCAWCARQSARAGPGQQNRAAAGSESEDGPGPRLGDLLLWLALAACGAGLLMATTNWLCTDMAVVPFLWILPLGLYLLTFVICFDSDRWYSRPLFCALLPVGIAAACVSLHADPQDEITGQIVIGAGSLFLCLMCCHGELARRRPHARHLTLFYLMIALGGALGGLFVAIIAPIIFDGIWEYPLLLFSCYVLVLIPAVRAVAKRFGESSSSQFSRVVALVAWSAFVVFAAVLTVLYFDTDRWVTMTMTDSDKDRLGSLVSASRVVALVIVLVAIASAARARFRRVEGPRAGRRRWLQPLLPGAFCLGLVPLAGILGWYVFGARQHVVERQRNFYGVLQVEGGYEDGFGDLLLVHGRTMHGFQNQRPRVRAWPSAYYGPLSGLGVAIRRHPVRYLIGRPFRIGVVGLGAGTIAAYGNALILPNVGRPPYARAFPRRPADQLVFYEINPIMIDWARRFFTFLADAEGRGASVETHLGDARIVMELQLARGEAQAFDVLAVDAFNSDAVPIHLLTNECFKTYTKHLAAEGILAFHVSNLHLDLAPVVHRLARHNNWSSIQYENEGDEEHGVRSSTWVLVTRNRAFLASREVAPLLGDPHRTAPLWTDDFSSVFPLLTMFR